MHFLFLSLISLIISGCSALPQLAQTVDDIATDDAITVKVDRDAFQKGTNVKVTVDVTNTEKEGGVK